MHSGHPREESILHFKLLEEFNTQIMTYLYHSDKILFAEPVFPAGFCISYSEYILHWQWWVGKCVICKDMMGTF